LNLISSFLTANLILVFFINGLAFFGMGLAITFEARRPSKLKLAESLWLLAAFAYLRSLANWAEMFLLIQRVGAGLNPAPTPASDNLPLQTAKALLLPLSYMFLLQFGIKTFIAANQRHLWLRWVHPALISFWLLALAQAIYSSPGASAEWLLAADVWARYLLYLPGSALAGLAVFLHCRVFRDMNLPHIARDCIGAAASFGLKAIVAGLVVSPAPYFPAFFLNESSFLAVVGVPVQVLRTITTLAIAYFVVRILEVFEIEQRRQLEAATQGRLQAQQEALEAQRQARQEIERWSNQLEDVVSTIAMAISQPLDLKDMLDTALRKALELTGLEVGTVYLVDDRAEELTLVAHHGLSQRVVQGVDRVKFDEGLTGRAARSGEPIVVEDISEDPRLTRMVVKEEGFRFQASVPLKSKDRVLGVITMASKGRRPFSPQEVTILTAIGQQIGVAIENARLYEQVQSMAALEERDRLGRELHDGLAQVLGYLHLKSKAVEGLLSSGEVAQAQAELREMQEVAQEAYGDVRESILGLRTTITPGAGLIPALTEYLHKFSQQSGISARLVVGDDARMEFAPAAEIQLLRIIQEALTNIRKHSQASRAWVRFEADREGVVITVEDDGQGFDPSRIGQDGQHHFGLQTMRERAESVGGNLHISTEPGQGTRVIVRLPFSRRYSSP
jgi:signal transduction histidine kinase